MDESIKQGVKYFVYSSVDRGGDISFNNPTDVPHFISKHYIEHHLVQNSKDMGMNWTILRPTAFYDNLVPGFLGKVFATSWDISLKGKPLQLIATRDIGYFAAEAFLNPESHKGKGISLAGDELTYGQMAETFQRKTEQTLPTTYQTVCYILLYMMKDMGKMFQWFHDEGYGAKIADLRKTHPGLKDFGTWLESESQFMEH